jgi:hypothetical protein
VAINTFKVSERSILRQYLWDPTVNNSGMNMPPFGRLRNLSEGELDMMFGHIYTL